MKPKLKTSVVLLCVVSLLFCGSLPVLGGELVWSTFLGGSSGDYADGNLVIDGASNVFVTGCTFSVDFPVTSGAVDTNYDGNCVVFVAKLSPSGDTLRYATYLEGSGIDGDYGYGIAVDDVGCACVTGATSSWDFPTTPGAFDTVMGGSWDAFVVKLSPDGNALDYGSYLGGLGTDYAIDIALDDSRHAFVIGGTNSGDFPVTCGAFDTTYGGSHDAYVAKFNAMGSELSYATYLGGSGQDEGYAIAVDGPGRAYLTGVTSSPDFPTTSKAFDTTYGGGEDAFVTRLSFSGGVLAYSTFLGGIDAEVGCDVAIDSRGDAYVIGNTSSADFPITEGAFDESHNGSMDVFVAKLHPKGESLIYSTFLGGSGYDAGSGIALNDAGDASVMGMTKSWDFPTTAWAFDTTCGGNSDTYVAKLDAGGSSLVYATFLGGSSDDDPGTGIAADDIGHLYVLGTTKSADFPVTVGAFDTTYNGSWDIFVARLDLSSPEQVSDLTAMLVGQNLLLQWSAVTADVFGNPLSVDRYCIYRDTTAHGGDVLDAFGIAPGLFYLDTTGAVGDTAKQFYYSVSAVAGGRESDLSRLVGECDRYLSSGE